MINYSLSYRTRYVDEGGTRVKKAYAYGKAQSSGSMTTAEFAKECCKTSVYGSGVPAAVRSRGYLHQCVITRITDDDTFFGSQAKHHTPKVESYYLNKNHSFGKISLMGNVLCT